MYTVCYGDVVVLSTLCPNVRGSIRFTSNILNVSCCQSPMSFLYSFAKYFILPDLKSYGSMNKVHQIFLIDNIRVLMEVRAPLYAYQNIQSNQCDIIHTAQLLEYLTMNRSLIVFMVVTN